MYQVASQNGRGLERIILPKESKEYIYSILDPVHPQKVDWRNLLVTMQSSRSDLFTKNQRSSYLVYELVAYHGGKKHFVAFLRPTLDRQYVYDKVHYSKCFWDLMNAYYWLW